SRRDSYLRVVLWSFSFVSFAHRALLSFPTRRSSDLEIVPFNKIPDIEPSVKGIILSGSPFSVEDKNAPDIDVEALIAQRPVLGVCYGAQLMAKKFGGKVAPSNKREYGRANLLRIFDNEVLFNGVSEHSQVWMSHGDTIMQLPEPFELLSSTGSIEV